MITTPLLLSTLTLTASLILACRYTSRTQRIPVPDGFKALKDHTAIHTPSSTRPAESRDPQLIILCTWMGASLKNIAKYTTGYQNNFPHTPILLIRCEPTDFLYQTYSRQRARLQPAVDVVRSYATDRPNPKVLLTCMSNGGINSAMLLSAAYQAKAHSSLPMTKLLLDSNPNFVHWDRAVKAFKSIVPRNQPAKAIGTVMVYVYFSYLILKEKLIDIRPFDNHEKWLNGEVSKDVKRFYVHSKSDEMVWWKAVVSNAEEAERLGYQVQRQVWEKGGHCALVKEDPQAYWQVVRGFWDGGD